MHELYIIIPQQGSVVCTSYISTQRKPAKKLYIGGTFYLSLVSYLVMPNGLFPRVTYGEIIFA